MGAAFGAYAEQEHLKYWSKKLDSGKFLKKKGVALGAVIWYPSLSLSFRRGAHVPGVETANRRVLLSFLEQAHALAEPFS
jgi:hypothetical protein